MSSINDRGAVRAGSRIRAVIVAAVAICAANFTSAQTVLITGANSGIGLEFSKQYAENGWTVIATHRRDEIPDTLAELMSAHENVRVETMDVSNQDQVFGLAEKLRGVPIDVLINNAGIFCLCDWMDESDTSQEFGTLRFDDFTPIMEVNVRGVAMVSEAFYENVKASDQKKMITITSTIGTISDPRIARSAFWYGASKAAVNKINVTLAEVVKKDNIIVVPMHPGSVRVEKQAELHNPGMLETPDSVRQMIATIDKLDISDSGKFLLYDGSGLPW
jgi:NAD(P)-dependent dehydrogenase (short-subunit alcohol dehydrogenase family)